METRSPNGGGIQWQHFRLDIDGQLIEDSDLAALIVGDLRLPMVECVTISKRVRAGTRCAGTAHRSSLSDLPLSVLL